MENNKNNSKFIVLLLIIIVLLLTGGGFLVYTLLSNNPNYNLGGIGSSNSQLSGDDNKKQEIENITETSLQEIISEQLYVLFPLGKEPVTNLNKLDNDSKLLVAFNMLKDKYTHVNNDITTEVTYVSSKKIEEVFNSSVISNLGIKHEGHDIYSYNDGTYARQNDLLVYSKASLYYSTIWASKVKKYEQNGNKYTVVINYLFADDMDPVNYYSDSQKKKVVTSAYDNSGNFIDAKEYLNTNYNSIKDKLIDYTYVFEKQNGKLVLTSFTVNK